MTIFYNVYNMDSNNNQLLWNFFSYDKMRNTITHNKKIIENFINNGMLNGHDFSCSY